MGKIAVATGEMADLLYNDVLYHRLMIQASVVNTFLDLQKCLLSCMHISISEQLHKPNFSN